jgi:hypothetical protein
VNQEIKKQWVAALRSGGYVQGRGTLRAKSTTHREVDKFCCLGVLCDLAVKSQVIESPTLRDDCGVYFYEEGNTALPPEKVEKWLGYGDETRSRFWALAELNDGGNNFNQIADYIEANL